MKIKKSLWFSSIAILLMGSLSAFFFTSKESIYAPTFATYTNHDEATYYRNISDTLTGSNLLSALSSLNSSRRKSTVGYSAMGTSASSPFKYTDYDPSTVSYDSNGQPYGTKVISFYSGNSMTSFNKEHVWPHSRGGNLVEADIHMPRPTIPSENGDRGNSFFVEGMNSKDNTGWDPRNCGDDTYRGDSARIIFYCTIVNSNLTLIDQTNDDKNNKTMGKLSDMIKWHLQYPIQQREKNRNEGAEYLQGNRNPFIDHPEYVCRIWGNTNEETRRLCENDPYIPVAPTSFDLDKTTVSIIPEETIEVKAQNFVPSNANKSVNYVISDTSIATVTSEGVITGVKPGTTTLTATSVFNTSLKKTCSITVREPANVDVSSVSFNLSSNEVEQGKTITYDVFANPSSAYPKPNIVVESSDTSIATVDQNNKVITGFKPGKVTITAKAYQNNVLKVSQNLELTVLKKDYVDGTITIDRDSFTNATGSYNWYPFKVNDISGEGFFYATTKDKIQVNTNKGATPPTIYNTTALPGVIKSVTVKTASGEKDFELKTSTKKIERDNFSNFSGTSSTKTATKTGVTWDFTSGLDTYFSVGYADSNAGYIASIEVTYAKPIEDGEVKLTSISVTNPKTNYNLGEDFVKPTVTAFYSDGDHKDVTSSAIFTGYDKTKVGNQLISVSYEENGTKVSTSFTINVIENTPTKFLTSITLRNQTIEYKIGDTFTFDGEVVAHYDDDSTSVVTPTSVSSPDMSTLGTKNVTVNYTEGEITKSASYDISVIENVPEEIRVTSVSLDFSSYIINAGESFKLTATINPTNADNKNVTWTSSDNTIATVDEEGNVTTIKNGNVNITVTTVDGGFTATCNVRVLGESSTPTSTSGCGGNIVTTSVLLSTISLLGIGLILIKKNKHE